MPTLLIAYDGSPEAGRAIRVAGALHPGASAVVACAYDPAPASVVIGCGMSGAASQIGRRDLARYAAEAEAEAAETAARGVAAASRSGLDARPAAVRATAGVSVGDALLAAVRETDADLVVIGSHGHSDLRSALTRTVSSAVLHHAPCPVLCVPKSA